MSTVGGPSVPPHITLEFDATPSAPRMARRALQPLLAADDDPIAEAVQLAVSELVSNVIKHTAGGGTMKVWDPKPDVPLRLEVTDSGAGEPAIAEEGRQVGGRGLRLVESLSDFWGVIQHAVGKTVWAEFYRSR